MIKKLLTLMFVAMLILSGCTKQEDKKSETAPVPEEALGNYYEKIAGRGMLSLDKDGLVTIDWSSSAFERAHWELKGEYDPESKRLNYKDGLMTIQTYTDETNYTEEQQYNDGTGYFTFEENAILWHNDKKDNGDGEVEFVRDSARAEDTAASMPNPWTETTNLNTAIKEAGFEFEQLTSDVLPGGVKLKTYMAMPGILSAIFEGDENNLLIRKSNAAQGKGLAGDYNDYSKTWSDKFKGLDITCEGDGEKANLAYFDIEGEHFSISYNAGQEGKGLTLDQIGLLSDALKTSSISK